MSVVRDFILIAVKVKTPIFIYFRSNEKNSVMSEVRGLGVVRKEKQRSGSSQIFHFNSSEVKSIVSIVRGFILTLVK